MLIKFTTNRPVVMLTYMNSITNRPVLFMHIKFTTNRLVVMLMYMNSKASPVYAHKVHNLTGQSTYMNSITNSNRLFLFLHMNFTTNRPVVMFMYVNSITNRPVDCSVSWALSPLLAWRHGGCWWRPEVTVCWNTCSSRTSPWTMWWLLTRVDCRV